MKHLTITLIFFGFCHLMASAQSSLQLSLNEALEYAIEHNKTIQNAKLDISLSERKTKEAISQGLPQVDATVDWMTYFGYEMEFPSFGGGPNTTDLPAEALIGGLMQSPEYQATANRFPGFDASNYLGSNELTSRFQETAEPAIIPMTDQSTAKLQVGQLLFSGQYWTGIKVAKLSQKIAEQGLENSILDIKEAVTNSYYIALVTEKSIATFKKSIESLQEVKGHTENMYKTGMAEQTDVDQISIQVTMLKNSLLSMERGLQMVYSMMKFQLGINPDQEINLTENLEALMLIIDPMSKKGYFDINSNTTFKLLQTQEEITEKLVTMEKMAYSPTLTGFYAYNYKILTTNFDMNPNHVAGASLSLPIFQSGTRKHKVSQAKIELDKVKLNKSMLEDQLNIQQKQLLLDLETAIENYNSQKENVELAQRVYDNIQNKFEQGMASSMDLTQSNSNYLQAESNYIQSIMSLLQAKVAIDKLYNQL